MMTIPARSRRSATPVDTRLARTPAIPPRPGRTPVQDTDASTDRLPHAVLGWARDRLGVDRLVCTHTPRTPPDADRGTWCDAARAAGIRRLVHLCSPARGGPPPDTEHGSERWVSADLGDPDQVRAALAGTKITPGPPVLVLTGTAPVHCDDQSLLHLVRTLADAVPAGSRIGLLQPCGATTRTDFARRTQVTGHGHHARTAHELLTLLAQEGFTDMVGPHPAATWPLPSVPASGADAQFALVTTPPAH